ncbi:MAG: hypothetical protein LIP01_06020 [Tannerellaceae bacterium]|nr:hypothetical protein [Tannerellaceae bacterium]
MIVTSLAGSVYLIFTPDKEQDEYTTYIPHQEITIATDTEKEIEEDDPFFFKPIITREGNLTKTILYTLKEGEELMYNEYHAMLTGNNQNFAAMIKDNKERQFFIFNGKKTDIEYDADIDYLKVEEPDGYCYTYQSTDGSYMNLFGTIIGPYNELQRLTAVEMNKQRIPTERELFYWYAYKNSEGWWVSSGKNSQIAGPFEKAKLFTLSEEKKQFGYAFLKEGYWYEIIEGKTYGPYEDGSPHAQGGQTEGNNYIFRYSSSGDRMVNHNNTKWGPYRYVGKIYLTPSNDYGFSYTANKEIEYPFYLHINGIDYGPYRYSENRVLFPAPGKFMYKAEGHDQKKYININGEIHGPYEKTKSWDSAYDMSPNGNYIYAYYTKENNTNYLNINGEVISIGQKEIIYAKIKDSGEYIYSYQEKKSSFEEVYYVATGDSLWGPYESYSKSVVGQSLFIADDKYMFGYRKEHQFYVNINGEIQGPFKRLDMDAQYSYLNADGSYKYGFYTGKNENLFICENGNTYPYSAWQKDQLPFSKDNLSDLESREGVVEIYSPDRKYQLEANWYDSYVTVNGEKYGNCTPTQLNYNPNNHSFVWTGIEFEYGYETISLVKYELLLDK